MGEVNIGVRFGAAALIVGVYAAIAVVYLALVRRAKARAAADGQTPPAAWEPASPWVRPLLPPAAVILCLLAIERLWEGYSVGSRLRAFGAFRPAVMGAWALLAWRSVRDQAGPGAAPDPARDIGPGGS